MSFPPVMPHRSCPLAVPLAVAVLCLFERRAVARQPTVDLLACTVQEGAEPKAAAEPPVTRPVAVPEPAPLAPVALVMPPKPPSERSRVAWIPWSMVAVGGLGMAYGGWALYVNGDSLSGSRLGPQSVAGHDTYSSKKLGVELLLGGVALLVPGVVWLVATSSSSFAVSASPNHVAFSLGY